MKQKLVTILALCLCLLLVLGGCQRQSGARQAFEEGASVLPEKEEQENPEAPEENPDEEGTAEIYDPEGHDAKWYADRYISGLSLQRLEDFETPSDLSANDLVAFFFMANYDGEDKLPIPEGYRSSSDGTLRLPGDEVESFVAALMDGVAEEDLRSSQYYDEEKHIYLLNGFGVTSGGSRVEVTDVQIEGDRVELVFDTYWITTDDGDKKVEIGPTATRCAAFLDLGDRFKVLSLDTLFQADMDKLMQEAGLL